MKPGPDRILTVAALAALLCSVAPAALAQTVSTANTQGSGISQEQALALTARLDALEQRNQELEDRISDLKAQVSAGDQALREDANAATKTSIANGRPAFASPDGKFTAQFRGVFQLDAAHYDQDAPGPQATDFRRGSVGDATEADHARDLNDGANFRRARIGVEGRAFGDWEYNFLYDFGGAGVEEAGKISAAWLQYDGFGPAKLRIGAFSPPAGIEEATSTNGSLFPERASPSELVRSIASGDGRTAIGLFANGERWNASAAISGNIVTQQTYDEQTGFVGRVAFVPLKGENYLVHVGANTSMVINPAATGPDIGPAGAATPIRLRDRPEQRVDVTRLVDTGNIDANGLKAFGGELAGQWKAFSAQGEYFKIKVDRRASSLSNPEFDGWYVQGAWTLTGQPRRYNIASATFDPPRVEKPFDLKSGAWGAFELAARYSDLDLNYQAGAAGAAAGAAGVRGGEQKISTIGLNWYPNAVVRFQADFAHVEVDRLSPGGTAFGAGVLTPPAGAQIGQDLNIWSFRTQYAF